MKAEEFWKKFEGYKDLIMDIDSLDTAEGDKLLERLDGDLKEYSEGIDFILGDLTDKGRTLTFTTEGDVDYFDDLIALCEEAPVLDFWDIIAFKPAKGSNVNITFEKHRISSKNLWFMPLESEEEKEKVGLRVALKEFVEDDEDLIIAVYSLIEQMLGEYDTAMLLGYLELCSLGDKPEEEGFHPMTDLPEYMEWFMNNSEE
jgi:hypothetical protein